MSRLFPIHAHAHNYCIVIIASNFFSDVPIRQQFSYVNRDRLTESETQTLLTRLYEDLERVKSLFSRLVSISFSCLQKHEVTYIDLKLLIMTHVPKSKLLEKLFSKNKTIDKTFLALRNYWSFFDYELLFLIISTFCSDLEEEKNSYLSNFKAFCKRKLSEVPTIFFSITKEAHYILKVSIGKEFESLPLDELKEFERKLRKITKIDLSISRIEEGSIVIVFASLNEESDMIPLSEQEKIELFEMGVFKLYSDNCVYFDRNEYQHSSMQDPHFIQSQQSTSNTVPFYEEWSVDYTQKEDASGTTLGSRDQYSDYSHPIIDSNTSSIFSQHSHGGNL